MTYDKAEEEKKRVNTAVIGREPNNERGRWHRHSHLQTAEGKLGPSNVRKKIMYATGKMNYQ